MKLATEFNKEKQRYEFVFDLEDGRHSAFFISLATLNKDTLYSCRAFEELFNRMIKMSHLKKETE